MAVGVEESIGDERVIVVVAAVTKLTTVLESGSNGVVEGIGTTTTLILMVRLYKMLDILTYVVTW